MFTYILDSLFITAFKWPAVWLQVNIFKLMIWHSKTPKEPNIYKKVSPGLIINVIHMWSKDFYLKLMVDDTDIESFTFKDSFAI